jgi:nascent polypeptide-associated complex subunit alpha
MFNMNPRQMEAAMRKMGIAQENIDAEEVIIRTKKEDIHIKNPSIQKIKAMGQISYQISGKEETVERSAAAEITEDDIKTVMEQANVSKENAKSALEKSKGDIAEAILYLDENKE